MSTRTSPSANRRSALPDGSLFFTDTARSWPSATRAQRLSCALSASERCQTSFLDPGASMRTQARVGLPGYWLLSWSLLASLAAGGCSSDAGAKKDGGMDGGGDTPPTDVSSEVSADAPTDTPMDSPGDTPAPTDATDTAPDLPVPTTLTATVLDRRQTSFQLRWPAPAATGGGPVAGYDIRVAKVPITATNFDDTTVTRTVTFTGTPAAPGAADAVVVSGLNIEQDYYFAVVGKDTGGTRGTIMATTTA